MGKMHVKKGDTVIVIAGKEKGKKRGKKKGPILRRYDRRGGGRIGPPGGYSLNL